jgi:DNA-binding CsgD family transcriptional regulator
MVSELASTRLADWVRVRLEALPAAAAAMAQAIALLRDRAQPRHLARLAGLDGAAAAAALDGLAGAELVHLGPPVEFVHPLVRRAVYDAISPARRAREHLRAARLLSDDGAEVSDVATQLLEGEHGGDAWAVGVLRAAATVALDRGAPEAAVPLLRRALEEPPPPGERPAILGELGHAELLALDPQGFEHLPACLDSDGPPAVRGRAALTLAPATHLVFGGHAAAAVIRKAIEAVGDSDRELTLQLEALLLSYSFIALDLREERAELTRRHLDALRGETPGERMLLGILTLVAATIDGEPEERVIDLSERALADLDLATTWPEAMMIALAAAPLCATRAYDRGLEWLNALIARGSERGWRAAWGSWMGMRATALMFAGDLRGAEADARAAIEVRRDAPHFGTDLLPVCVLAEILVETGDLAGADSALADADPRVTESSTPNIPLFLNTRARLHLARSRHQTALEDALRCGQMMTEAGAAAGWIVLWRSPAALAHAALGNREGALALSDEELAVARAAGSPLAIGTALRTHGLVSGGEQGIGDLEQAVQVLGDSPFALEHTRALVDLGAALRRAKRRVDARESLRQGLELAQRCGASALAQRAHEELAATGARPRRIELTGVDSLTASERRVAQMAAQGMTNREIAQALFVTIKTVQKHLGNTYMKLDVTREQLPAALGAT